MKKLVIMSRKKLDQLIEQKVSQALEKEKQDFEREILIKQANLATLQSQINPHFLYNTLECIRGIALMENQENIANIALSLSQYFRYSISGKSDIASLQDELSNVRAYAKIQNYRFQNRFVLEIIDDESVANAMLPKLTLQPIVENAILHGLANTVSGGVVSLRVSKVGADLVIVVSDNGCGMTPDELAVLTQEITAGTVPKEGARSHTGIGISNVNRRLRLYFSPEYGISVYSCPNVGTDVELRIPYHPLEKH